jgi:nucleoside-diphosphate-sugar epimerase
MLLVTGGAGFIGSNVVAGLNEAGRADAGYNANFTALEDAVCHYVTSFLDRADRYR